MGRGQKLNSSSRCIGEQLQWPVSISLSKFTASKRGWTDLASADRPCPLLRRLYLRTHHCRKHKQKSNDDKSRTFCLSKRQTYTSYLGWNGFMQGKNVNAAWNFLRVSFREFSMFGPWKFQVNGSWNNRHTISCTGANTCILENWSHSCIIQHSFIPIKTQTDRQRSNNLNQNKI